MMTIERFVPLAAKLALIFLGAVVVLVAVPFLMFGAALGLSEAFDVSLWLGLVLTGASFLLLTFFFFLFASISAQKKILKKKAETKAAVESLWHQVATMSDLKQWTQQYPFCSTGAAAAFGFSLSGAMAPVRKPEESKTTSSSAPQSIGVQPSFMAIALLLAEEFLIPYLQASLKSKEHGNTSGFPQ